MAERRFWINVKNNKRVLVKIQAGYEKENNIFDFQNETWTSINEGDCWIYDKSRKVSGIFNDQRMVDLISLHGRLGHRGYRSKKIFLYAIVDKNDFSKLVVYTDIIVLNVDDW